MSTARLVDMLDFSRKDFNKSISLTPKKSVEIETKWELVNLENIAKEFFAGGDAPKTNFSTIKTDKFKIPIYANGFQNKGLYGFTDVSVVNEPCITISARGTLGYTEVRAEPFVPIVRLIVVIPNDLIDVNYLKIAVSRINFIDSGSVIPQLTIPKIKSIKIPLPPIDIQQQIVAECEAIDTEVQAAEQVINNSRLEIEASLANNTFIIKRLSEVAFKVSDSINPQEQEGKVDYIGLENIESQTGCLVGETKTPYLTIKSTKTCFKQYDVLYGKLRPNLNKVYLAEQEGICSTDILVFRFVNKELAKFYAYYFLSKPFNDEVLKGVNGQQLPRTSWSYMQTIKIPVPDIKTQQTLITQIEQLENKIATAQKIINEAANKKQAILKKYL